MKCKEKIFPRENELFQSFPTPQLADISYDKIFRQSCAKIIGKKGNAGKKWCFRSARKVLVSPPRKPEVEIFRFRRKDWELG